MLAWILSRHLEYIVHKTGAVLSKRVIQNPATNSRQRE